MTLGRATTQIWVDTDVALGASSGDVDDGFALAALAAVHRLSFIGAHPHGPRRSTQLLGVSVVSGNTDAATAQRCAENLLLVAGLEDVPVVEAKRAPSSIAALPEDAILLSLGPMTNIANALRLEPSLVRRVDLRVVATVRSRWRLPFLRHYCVNTHADRDSAAQVLSAGFNRLRHIPLDVARRLSVGRRELNELAATGTMGEYLSGESERWLEESLWRYRSRRFPLWDLVAALDALDLLDEASRDARALVGYSPRESWDNFVEVLRSDQHGS